MKKIVCPACGGETKRNGRTSSGRTRRRCKSCGASTTQSHDNTARLLKLFVEWLPSRLTQGELGMPARTSRFRAPWPTLPTCDEAHHVVYVDRLRMGRAAVLLIACTDDHVCFVKSLSTVSSS